jgi:hypothetical protein
MAQRPGHERLEEELVEDNFSTTQQLALRLDSHSSTLNFTLETLAQHRSLINQLQDEVDYLRRQGERIEAMHEVRTHNSTEQSQNEETGSRADPVLPDLNVALEPPPEEERGPEEDRL